MGKLGTFYRYKIRPDKRKKYEHIYKIPVIHARSKPEIVASLLTNSQKSPEDVLKELNTTNEGLSDQKSRIVLSRYGLNEVTQEKRESWPIRLFKTFANALNFLLFALIIISLVTKDTRTATIILTMICISVGIKFFQESQAYNSAEALKSMVKTTCTVIRNGRAREIDLKRVVPGDIISLTAGDLIPADLRLIESKELFANQSILTGESLPVEKHVYSQQENITNPLELHNICYMGTNVESGRGLGVVLQTGPNTYFGSLAKDLVGQRIPTSFDKGIDQFTWLMVGFMAIMVPTVFLINGLTKGNWFEAFMFGLSIAVGLTPEMLPALVAINLSKGAIALSKKKVIVKRLNSIQNFGAMDILCTDKTGTITQNRIVMIDNVNINGKTDLNILNFAFINSIFQTAFKNLLDSAVIKHGEDHKITEIKNDFQKIDELPFDFVRRRLSVIVEDKNKQRTLICKGAVEEVLNICSQYEVNGKTYDLGEKEREKLKKMSEKYSRNGFRVITIAHRHIESGHDFYTQADEKNLVFSGLMTFLDPPKESAATAIKELNGHGVAVKILTGDNELVTQKIAHDVGLNVDNVLMGYQIEKMTDEDLKKVVEKTTVFAKLSPEHKRRVIVALQKTNHVVGFLGDGINDAPGLRAADIGISVDGAVDIAKESADIILLEMSLSVLSTGVVEGRKVFGNIIKYVKMGASSNFGNMFSVIGASLFVPFLPMMPIQVLVNNLLYDISQTAIPTDKVDDEYTSKPRKWEIKDIGRFMIFIGPMSSIFDYATYLTMLFIFKSWNNPSLFQTGWFVESLVTQTMIVHVIRSRQMPFFQTWASLPLVLTTICVIGTGIALTYSPIASSLHFTPLPPLYWPILIFFLLTYILITQVMKSWYYKKFGYH